MIFTLRLKEHANLLLSLIRTEAADEIMSIHQALDTQIRNELEEEWRNPHPEKLAWLQKHFPPYYDLAKYFREHTEWRKDFLVEAPEGEYNLMDIEMLMVLCYHCLSYPVEMYAHLDKYAFELPSKFAVYKEYHGLFRYCLQYDFYDYHKAENLTDFKKIQFQLAATYLRPFYNDLPELEHLRLWCGWAQMKSDQKAFFRKFIPHFDSNNRLLKMSVNQLEKSKTLLSTVSSKDLIIREELKKLLLNDQFLCHILITGMPKPVMMHIVGANPALNPQNGELVYIPFINCLRVILLPQTHPLRCAVPLLKVNSQSNAHRPQIDDCKDDGVHSLQSKPKVKSATTLQPNEIPAAFRLRIPTAEIYCNFAPTEPQKIFEPGCDDVIQIQEIYKRKVDHSTQYQTSFEIHRTNKLGEANLFEHLLEKIYSDFLEQEPSLRRKLNLDDFVSGVFYTREKGDYATLKTTSCLGKEKSFFCEYIQKKNGVDFYHYKICHLGLREFNGYAIFYIKVFYVDVLYLLEGAKYEIPTTVPSIVSSIFESMSYSIRQQKIRYNKKYKIVKKEDVEALSDELSAQSQHIVCLILYGEAEKIIPTAEYFTQHLIGKANVYLVIEDDVRDDIEHILCVDEDTDMPVNSGAFFLCISSESDGCRWIFPLDEPEHFENFCNTINRKYNILCNKVITSEQDVLILKKQNDNQLKKEKINQERAKNKHLRESPFTQIAALESQLEGAKERNQQLQSELSDLRDSIIALQHMGYSMPHAVGDDTPNDFEASGQLSLYDLPPLESDNLESVVLLAKTLLNNLIIDDNAIKSARKYVKFDKLEVAWAMLAFLNEEMHPKLLSGDNEGDVRKWVEENNPQHISERFSYSYGEGRNTQRSLKIMNQRQFSYKDKYYACVKHLGYGSRTPNMLRIYFDLVLEENKLFIAHIGEHLSNFSTHKIKN